MKKKEFMLIGLGQLGKNLVKSLYNSDIDLLVIDKDSSKLEEIEEMAVQAICADASKEEILNQIEIKSFDGAIVTMGNDIESSVKIVMHLSEMGMPFIMAKATSEFEGRILRKVGADKVIFPEREVGIRLGKEIAFGNYYDSLDLSDTYSITDLNLPDEWRNKSIMQLNLRKTYGLNVIGIRRDDELIINPGPNEVFYDEDVLIVLGSNEDIHKARKK
ncbi:MAG: potassium channel family protein [Acutalibacteraceae bacterium]